MRVAMIIPGWGQYCASDFDSLATAPVMHVMPQRRNDHFAKNILNLRATGIPAGQA